MEKWEEWRAFPNPQKGMFLIAPFGVGIYELRNRSKNQQVLFGIGSNCAYRMSSLLPKPYGSGTRNNNEKRDYVLRHIDDIEYRCMACESGERAKEIEKEMKKTGHYLFNT